MASQEPLNLAVLDDYQNIAPSILQSHLASHPITITSIPTTLHTPTSLPSQTTRLQPYHIISTMRERTAFPASLLSRLPNLRLLLTTGTRNASIDLQACQAHGITVLGTSGRLVNLPIKDARTGERYDSLSTTAEVTMALILGCAKLLQFHGERLREGGWQGGAFTVGLGGRVLGLVGYGRIGRVVGRMAREGFGMRIIAWSENLTQSAADEVGEGVEVVGSKEEVFARADFVSLHYVLSERSRGLVGRRELGWMKKEAFLVNTSRGGLIDEEVLLEVLEEGGIAGVGLDVFTTEPLPVDSPWRTTRWGEDGRGHAVLSPHVGYSEEQVIRGWYQETAENLVEYLKGNIPEPVLARPDES